MSALVLTGATGFLGRALLDELEAHGELEGVIALCRRPSAELSRRGVSVRVGALDDAEWLTAQLPAGCRIVHLAGKVDFIPGEGHTLHALHVDATRVLAKAALEAACSRFVLMSSSGTTAVSKHPYAHDETAPYPIPIISRWPYYQSKLFQEKLVLDLHRREGLPAIVLNPSLLLGPGDDRGGSTAVVADAIAGRIPLAPSGGIGMVDVRDVAKATRAALTQGRIGERYFLGSLNCRFTTFFELLEACGGPKAPVAAAPKALAVWGAKAFEKVWGDRHPERAAAMAPEKMEMAAHFWYVDWRKAERELGFTPRLPEVTLRDTLAYLRTQPLSV